MNYFFSNIQNSIHSTVKKLPIYNNTHFMQKMLC